MGGQTESSTSRHEQTHRCGTPPLLLASQTARCHWAEVVHHSWVTKSVHDVVQNGCCLVECTCVGRTRLRGSIGFERALSSTGGSGPHGRAALPGPPVSRPKIPQAGATWSSGELAVLDTSNSERVCAQLFPSDAAGSLRGVHDSGGQAAVGTAARRQGTPEYVVCVFCRGCASQGN